MKQIKSKNINFYSRLLLAEDKKKDKKKNLKTIIIIYASSVAALIAIAIAGTEIMRSKAETALEEAKDNIQKSEMTEIIAEDNALTHSNEAYEKIIDSYDENNALVEKADIIRKRMSPDLIDTIMNCQSANLNVKSIDFSDDMLKISCISDFADVSSEFVTKLEKTELFAEVDYSGFVEQGKNYVFTVTAVFKNDES